MLRRPAPQRLRWETESGFVETAFADVDTLRLRGEGLGLRLTDAAVRPDLIHRQLPLHLAAGRVCGPHVIRDRPALPHHIDLAASSRSSASELLGAGERGVVAGADGGAWEIADRGSGLGAGARAADRLIRRGRRGARRASSRRSPTPSLRGARTIPAATLAAYVLWSATVRPLGFVTRETVLMSKHWMDKVWSWDHCFNALALAPLASRARTRSVSRRVRPSGRDRCAAGLDHPLRGALQLRQAADPRMGLLAASRTPAAAAGRREVLAEVYRRLAAWSRYWLDHRRAPGQRAAVLRARQRQRLGQLDRVRRRPPRRIARPRRLPRPAARRARSPRSRGRARRSGRLAGGSGCSWPTLLEELWDGERLRRAVRGRPPPRKRVEPADRAADRGRRTRCPPASRPRARRQSRRRTSPSSGWRRSSSTRRNTTQTAIGAVPSGRPRR